MGDPALSRDEFYQWLSNSFRQHVEANTQTRERVEKLSLAVFGDGNGVPGIQADVKHLVCVSRRINAWLDGVSRLGRFGGALLIVAAAGATFGKTMGWL